MRTRELWLMLVLVAILAVAMGLAGCQPGTRTVESLKISLAQVQEQSRLVGESLAAMRAEQAELAARIEALPEGPQREQAQASLAQSAEMLKTVAAWQAKLDTAAASLTTQLASAQDDLDLIAAGAQTAAGLVPLPWQPWAALISGVVGTAIVGIKAVRAGRRADQAETNLAGTVRSVQVYREDLSPEAKAAMNRILASTQAMVPGLADAIRQVKGKAVPAGPVDGELVYDPAPASPAAG